MARTLPNLNLKAFFALGEDGWNDEVDTNFLKLSTLVQGGVSGIVASKPASPAAGTVVIVGANDSTNPNTVAVFDDGVWQHFAPKKGWMLFDNGQNSYVFYNGSTWGTIPLTSAKLAALASLDGSQGLVYQTGTDSFSKRSVGVAATSDILTRGHADNRFAALVHTHSDMVSTFNGRMGTVSLTSSDITTALGFAPQAASPTLSGLSLIGTNSGLVEQTGATSFAKRTIGVNAPNSILDRAAADARYAAITPTLTGLGSIGIGEGVIEQTGVSSFTKRKIDVAADSASLTTVGFADARYLQAANSSFRQLTDAPTSYAGMALRTLRVKGDETGIEFSPAGTRNVLSVGTTVYVLGLHNAGQVLRCTHAAETVITVPENANTPFPIGTVIHLTRVSGNVRLITDAAAYLDLPAGKKPEISGRNGSITLTKVTTNRWIVCGDLANTVVTVSNDYEVSDEDYLIRVDTTEGVTVNIPTDLAHHAGTSFMVVQAGTGSVTISASSGVILNGISELTIPSQWSKATLTKVDADVWDVSMAAPYSYTAPQFTLRADSESVTADSTYFTVDEATYTPPSNSTLRADSITITADSELATADA